MFCPSKFEEILYNIVMGFVYCFCYINLRDGKTRYRLILFYTLIISQNFGSLLLYILISDTEKQKKMWSIAATSCIVFGTIIGKFLQTLRCCFIIAFTCIIINFIDLLGICSMISYYKFFHWKGPILWKNPHSDIELNNRSDIQESNLDKTDENILNHVRSFKNSNKNRIAVVNLR